MRPCWYAFQGVACILSPYGAFTERPPALPGDAYLSLRNKSEKPRVRAEPDEPKAPLCVSLIYTEYFPHRFSVHKQSESIFKGKCSISAAVVLVFMRLIQFSRIAIVFDFELFWI